MTETDPELRAAIDAAKERIKVDTYYPRAMNAGLKGNAQGFWSGTALGLATGAVGGGLLTAALALAGFVAGAATGPGALMGWPMVLGLAGIGGTMGGVTGARIGAGSGAIASVAAERERRDKAEKLEQEILQSPEKQREVIEAYRKDPVVERNDTAKEIFATTRGKGKAFGKIINWPTFFVCVAICAAVSMVLFGGAFALAGGLAGATVPSGLGMIGMTSLKSALAIGAGTGATVGASFGIAYPPIFAGLTKVVADLLSGKLVRGESNFPRTKTVAEMENEAVQNRTASEQRYRTRTTSPVTIRIAADASPTTEIHDIAAMGRMQAPLAQQVGV